MQINKIEISYLLSRDEYILWNLVYNRMGQKRKAVAALYIIFGVFSIGFGLILALKAGVFNPGAIAWIFLGILLLLFYEILNAGILLKKKAKNFYETHKQTFPSYNLETDGETILFHTDKYSLHTQPQALWKCIETKDLFVFFISANSTIPVPKRPLTAQQAEDLRAVFMRALPKEMYVNNSR